jgi:hypothetical protein
VAGGGFYYLKPHWDTNPAFLVRVTDLSTSSYPTIQRQIDFDWDAELAPLIWLGYVGCDGCGVRARYWRFDEDTHLAVQNHDQSGATSIGSAAPLGLALSSPGPLLGGDTVHGVTLSGAYNGKGNIGTVPTGADGLTFASTLELDVVDLEATQDVHMGCWSLLFSGGVRYARLSQKYSATRFNSGSFDTWWLLPTRVAEDSATLDSEHEFEGVGPTAAVEARRVVGCTGLILYGSARGALLFGKNKQDASLGTAFRGDYLRPNHSLVTFDRTTFTHASASGDDVLPVLELELGVEFAHDLGAALLLLRAGVVSQTWFGAGNAANNDLLVAGGDEVADNDSDLGLFGLKFEAGLQF